MHKGVSAAPCFGAQVFVFYPDEGPLKRQPRLRGAERRLSPLPVRFSGALAAATAGPRQARDEKRHGGCGRSCV
jgi:hypothetical protein